MKSGEYLVRFETDIRDTAYGGYGVGTLPDGRIAFIPFTVEGDRVSAEVKDDKKDFVYADLSEVLTPSEFRGEIYCPHLGRCGGCLFGHIDYAHQLEIKKRIVAGALRKISCVVPDAIISGEPLRYRNRVTFKVKDGQIGFYAFKSRDFIPVDDCPIVSGTLVKKCEKFAAANKSEEIYELYAVENQHGEALANVKDLKNFLFVEFDGVVSGDSSIGQEYMEINTPAGGVYISPESFMQSNRFLMGRLQELAADGAGVNVLELYCGSGFFTVALADMFRSVTAVEVSKEAVRLGKQTGLENVRWVAANAGHFLKTAKGRFDQVFADPPRTGLDKNVVNYIKNTKPATVTYVSCNPTTLARDVKRLDELYAVESLTVLDMFPNTYHIEMVAKLRLK
jgi:23S rRNA (uracil1939-C5)-methyltransferase